MKSFYRVLANTLIASVTNNFLWFALTFWIYLETKSLIASSIVGASYPLLSAISGLVFGTYVDRTKRKIAMLRSSQATVVLFSLASFLYFASPADSFLNLANPVLWIFVAAIMCGAVAGNLRHLALATLVTILVPDNQRDRANGLVGTVTGISFAITSVFSGLAIGLLGMGGALAIATLFTLVTLAHLYFIDIDEPDPKTEEHEKAKAMDIRGAIAAINKINGLWGLIIFSMINNLFGGIFMALMDPYGLELVSVEVWGAIWGVLSFAFILGGILVAKFGLGKNPLYTMFMTNIIMWLVAIVFPIQASIVLLMVGMFVYMTLIPIIEASEQTLLQRVVPFKVQGRVFGFAQMAENITSPFMALLIGPFAQFVMVPFMTDGAGAQAIGAWFGTGTDRGIALLFMLAGVLGLIVTLVAFNSPIYRNIRDTYVHTKPQDEHANSK